MAKPAPPKVGFVHSLIHDGGETAVHHFTVLYFCDHDRLDPCLRQAIRAFLKTPLGKEQAVSNGGDFNWGDAAVGIPGAFWRKYGICSFYGADPSTCRLVVDHDENFFHA